MMLKSCSRLLSRCARAHRTTASSFAKARNMATLTPASDDPRFKSYELDVEGEPGQEGFRMEYMKDGKKISPWHDIPLRFNDEAESRVNFLCEIPRFSRAKMEVATGEAMNPLIQDRNKDGSLRDYHGPIFWCVFLCLFLLIYIYYIGWWWLMMMLSYQAVVMGRN